MMLVYASGHVQMAVVLMLLWLACARASSVHLMLVMCPCVGAVGRHLSS